MEANQILSSLSALLTRDGFTHTSSCHHRILSHTPTVVQMRLKVDQRKCRLPGHKLHSFQHIKQHFLRYDSNIMIINQLRFYQANEHGHFNVLSKAGKLYPAVLVIHRKEQSCFYLLFSDCCCIQV